MWGAIIGDIAGSTYERRSRRQEAIENEKYPFFPEGSRFTDDTVTTVAVATAMLTGLSEKTGITRPLCRELRYWCRRYPHAGFGPAFKDWFRADDIPPYGSWGNGAAMRVSPAGWLGRDLGEVRMLAELSAVVTHNCEEAVRGAIAVASAIFLARTGADMAAIRKYLQDYYYPLGRTLAEIRPTYRFSSRTAASVPEAIEAFLESTGFEDAIRKAISLGGDADTQGAIAGSIAEAYYGVPEELMAQAASFLPDDIRRQVDIFYTYIKERE